MTKNMKSVRRQSFTLVEVIAVLLVIAILAAVAAPKFVNMAAEARNGVAKAGINEAKASLSVAYAKTYLLTDGEQASCTATNILSNAGIAVGDVTFGDIVVTVAKTSESVVTLTAKSVRNVTTGVSASDTWNVPTGN